MKPEDKFKNLIREIGMEIRPEWLAQTKNDVLNTFQQASSVGMPAEKILRINMIKRMTSIAAAIIIIGGMLGLTLLKGPVEDAYAIEQTIAAIETIHTVYFKAEFFRQGPVECWMQFSDKNGKPTHLCLFMTGSPFRKVDTPHGTFLYNTITNRYMQTQRDERQKNWYLNFSRFFQDSLKAAKNSSNITITRRVDTDMGKEMIVIDVLEDKRTVEYLIDPQTKLPESFTTRQISNFMYYYRQTIAVRNMSDIQYNLPIPEAVFAIPPDAELVTNEHDVIVQPDTGISADGLSREQACVKIVRDVADAMNARDWHQVSKLVFPFELPPKEMQSKLPEDVSQPLVDILELGKPYEKNGYWYISSKTRESGGQIKEKLIPIKFYEFNGKQYCMIMWSD